MLYPLSYQGNSDLLYTHDAPTHHKSVILPVLRQIRPSHVLRWRVAGVHPANGGNVRTKHPFLGFVARSLTCIAVVICLLRLTPAVYQQLPLVSNLLAFTPWVVLMAAIALVLALISRRWFTAILAVICIGAQLYWQAPFYRGGDHLDESVAQAARSGTAPVGGSVLRVMTCNVYEGHANAAQIVQTVREQHVQVLAMQEITKSFVARLDQAGIASVLPYDLTVSIAHGGTGNGLWSAIPLTQERNAEIDSVASNMPAATLWLDGGSVPLRFVSVHTTSPRPGQWDRWYKSIEQIGDQITRSATNADYVLMGDFNASYDHAPLRDVLGDRFKDATQAAGEGLKFSWPADKWPIPAFSGIDHILVEHNVTVGDVQTVHIQGTDHRALLATLQVA